MVIPEKSEDLNHSIRRRQPIEEFFQDSNGILVTFQFRIAEGHSEFGFVQKRTSGIATDQLLKTPEGFLKITFFEQNPSFPEEGCLFEGRSLRPGRIETLKEEKEERKGETQPLSFFFKGG
jgi:hypothetical protein